MTEVLGNRLYVAGWALRGSLPPAETVAVLKGVVARVGMSTQGLEPTVHQYPLPSGKGGVGYTIYTPFAEAQWRLGLWQKLRLWLGRWLLGRQRFASIVFQPLTESFVVADSYPEINRTYVVLASCLPLENVPGVSRYLARRVGPVLNQAKVEL